MSTAAKVAVDGLSVTVQVPLAFRWQADADRSSCPRVGRGQRRRRDRLASTTRWCSPPSSASLAGRLEGGGYGTIEELARAERINPSYLARVLRRTLLAPETMESIIDGRHNLERVILPGS